MPLTVKQALNAKPGRHSDGKGLYLLVKPTGSKSWVLRVQHKGKRQDFGLGSLAAETIEVAIPLHKRRSLTLAEAREKARIGRELAKAGINPSAEWKLEEEEVPDLQGRCRAVSRAGLEGLAQWQARRSVAEYAQGLRLSRDWQSYCRSDRGRRCTASAYPDLADERGNGATRQAAHRRRSRLCSRQGVATGRGADARL